MVLKSFELQPRLFMAELDSDVSRHRRLASGLLAAFQRSGRLADITTVALDNGFSDKLSAENRGDRMWLFYLSDALLDWLGTHQVIWRQFVENAMSYKSGLILLRKQPIPAEILDIPELSILPLPLPGALSDGPVFSDFANQLKLVLPAGIHLAEIRPEMMLYDQNRKPEERLSEMTLPLTRQQNIELYILLKSGCPAAVEKCRNLYLGAVRKIIAARLYFSHHQHLEDIVNDVFLGILESVQSDKFNIAHKQNLGGYINGITNYKILEYRRDRARHRNMESFENDYVAPIGFDCIENRELLEIVYNAMDKLKPEHRQFLTWRYLDDLDLDEIQEKINLPKPRISEKIHYSMALLRKELVKKGLFSQNLVGSYEHPPPCRFPAK